MKRLLLRTMLCFSVSLTVFADDNYIPVITVLDFELNGLSKAEGRIFLDFLSSHIARVKSFRLIDRSQRDSLLAEMEFSMSGCSDESCQLEIGKMLAADYIIVGSIGTLGNRYLLNIKLIRVASSVTEHSASEKYATIDDLVDDSGRLIRVLFDLDADEIDTTDTGRKTAALTGRKSNSLAGDGNSGVRDSMERSLDLDRQVLQIADGSVYEGEVFQNMAHGPGIRTWPNGNFFEGTFLLGYAVDGYIYYKEEDYTANYFQTVLDEWIELKDAVELSWENGNIYFGQAVNNLPKGYGCLYYADGSIEAGIWENNALSGYGTGEYSNGGKFAGQYKLGYFDGNGEYWDQYGNYYSGQFLEGYYHGEGTFTWKDGTVYQGQYSYGYASGGTIYYPDGTIAKGY
ncbi:MAG: hypothetical protein JW874_14965, partial [Spirochaetales bacterium]|nr:hypothetical protein [Spirochaetales bacterium]